MKLIKLFLFASLYCLACADLIAQDTVKLFFPANQSFQLTAPQKYYKNYEWEFPNNSSIQEKTITLAYSNPGKYNIICKASDSCSEVVSNIPFELEIIDSANTNDPIEYISLFPNPVFNNGIGPKLLVTSNGSNINLEVTIYANNGRLLYSFNEILSYGANLFDYSSSFSSQGSGSYYMNVKTNSARKSFIFTKL